MPAAIPQCVLAKVLLGCSYRYAERENLAKCWFQRHRLIVLFRVSDSIHILANTDKDEYQGGIANKKSDNVLSKA